MQCNLLPHPSSPPSPIHAIGADVSRLDDGRVGFVFMAVGDIRRLRVPPEGKLARVDGLWRHTCFEAFVRSKDAEAYFEFNFAPSHDWAAYRFDHYRSGMVPADVEPPTIKGMADANCLSLIASIDLGPIPELVPWQDWQIGLSAVIEADDGTVSHWALAHPAGVPDFHDKSCFQGQVAPAATL